jgi:hypothetical protein
MWIMAVMDGAIANVALPTIAQDLHASPAFSIWTVNGYQPAITISLLPPAAEAHSNLGATLFRKRLLGGQFWGSDSDAIPQLFVRKIILAQQVDVLPGNHRGPPHSRNTCRLAAWKASSQGRAGTGMARTSANPARKDPLRALVY